MITATLRIKKVFFDQILDGSKTKEYRDAKDFYDRLFAIVPDELLLHYQKGRKLRVQVRGLRRIKTPKRLKNSICGFGSHVYCISLGKARLV